MDQNTVNARDIQTNDYLMFGNSLYRVVSVGPKNYDKTSDRIRVDLITDQRYGPASKIIIECELDADHIVTVFRLKR